jgi:hypothetical protein
MNELTVSRMTRSTCTVVLEYPLLYVAKSHCCLLLLYSTKQIQVQYKYKQVLYEYITAMTMRKMPSRLLFLQVLVIVLLSLAGAHEEPEYGEESSTLAHSSTTSTSTRQEQIVAFLKSRFVLGNPAALQDPTSPQSMAATWMATADGIDIPESNAYADSFPFVQRYTLAVLYFAWSSGNSSTSIPFLSSDDECDWNVETSIITGETITLGAQCNEAQEIDRLILRKFGTGNDGNDANCY